MTPDEMELARRRYDLSFTGIAPDRDGVREYFKKQNWPYADFAFKDGRARKASPLPMHPSPLPAGQEETFPVVDMSYTNVIKTPVVITHHDLTQQPERPDRKGSCPPSPMSIALPEWVYDDGPIAVFSDFHIPFHSAQFIDRAVEKSLREGVKRFIIAGDLTDSNQLNARRGLGVQHGRRWQQDIDLARSVVAYLCANFPESNEEFPNIVFFGNHDEWVNNMTKGQVTAEWLYAYLFPDLPIKWVSARQVVLMNGGETFLIVHGEKFSHPNPMGVVEQYALHRRMHTIAGHMHYAAQWQSGPYQLILNGGCFDRQRMSYIHEGPKPMRETQTGFTIISGGRATLYAGRENWS